MSWDQIYSKMQELIASGLTGDAAADALEKWSLEAKPYADMGVHDFFNVSEEEEASWYDDHIVFKSFDEVSDYISNHGLDVSVGFLRNALRQMPEEATEYAESFLVSLESLCQQTVFGDSKMLSVDSITTFESVCFFAAEKHIESFFKPIMNCLRALHTEEYQPLSEFVFQCLPSLLYAICDGDFAFVLDTLLDTDLHHDIRDQLGRMLVQYALDGVFPDDVHRDMLKQYVNFIVRNDENGLIPAEWIALANMESIPRKVLKRLLRNHVDPMYYGTIDPKEFTELVRSSPRDIRNYVMDDMILFGMYLPVLHPPEGLREKVADAQKARIERFRQKNH